MSRCRASPLMDDEMDDNFEHWFDALEVDTTTATTMVDAGEKDPEADGEKLKDSSDDDDMKKDETSVGEA